MAIKCRNSERLHLGTTRSIKIMTPENMIKMSVMKSSYSSLTRILLSNFDESLRDFIRPRQKLFNARMMKLRLGRAATLYEQIW